MRRAFQLAGQHALSLLFPRVGCIACGAERPLSLGLCADCREDWRAAPPKAPAALIYAGAAGASVRRLKYGGERDIAQYLAAAMRERLPEGPWDALVPVPLSVRRRRARGFNQAEDLARAVWLCGGPRVLRALRRVRDTPQQAGLSREVRLTNVAGSFAALGQVRGLRLLVIDDVVTTGATTSACREALVRAGASAVGAFGAAYALPGEDAPERLGAGFSRAP